MGSPTTFGQSRDRKGAVASIAEDSSGDLSTNTSTAYAIPTNGFYAYDSNGNMTFDGYKNFAYDDENQLIGIWVSNAWSNSFAYDGKMRRRIERDYTYLPSSSSYLLTNEVHLIYDGNLVVEERNAGNVPTVSYTRGNDMSGSLEGAGGIGGLLARTTYGQEILGAPTTVFYHADGNGNIAALMYPNQQLAAKYLYDPFGNMLAMSGPLMSFNKYRFSSKEWNNNAGLYYYDRRFYEPGVQRWLNRDPIHEKGGLNLYSFTINDPINRFDPIGDNTFDLVLKLLGLQVPKAFGVTAGGFMVAGSDEGVYAYGANTAVIFFPDTCELAAYSVTVPDAKGVGVMATLGAGLEYAIYGGDSAAHHANADSYTGIFYTAQQSADIFGASEFFSLPNEYGGFWVGIDVTIGAGAGAAVNEWDYEYFNPNSSSKVTLANCVCYPLILFVP
jgi:RHS repeat-associated protein